MLKIGEIGYANVYPIFHRLKQIGRYRFIRSYPSLLNKALRDGGIDISCASSIEYARYSHKYLILPDISISSLKSVKSVCLFSNYELPYLKNKLIYLTPESSTSIILLKIVLMKFFEIPVHFTSDSSNCDASLLIGDKALYEYYNPSYKYIYDLGKIWFEKTSLPFVYALWLVNRATFESKPSEVKKFQETLLTIKRDSKKNLSTLIDFYYFKGLTSYQIIDYWETIDYELSNRHITGLKTFYKLAYEIDELKSIPDVSFLPKVD